MLLFIGRGGGAISRESIPLLMINSHPSVTPCTSGPPALICYSCQPTLLFFFFFFQSVHLTSSMIQRVRFFKKHILLIMILQCSHFPSFIPLHPMHPLPYAFPLLSSCPWTKFLGFYISYTILTLPLSIFHLSSMLLILYTFPLSPPPAPLLITLHVISISVVLFLL